MARAGSDRKGRQGRGRQARRPEKRTSGAARGGSARPAAAAIVLSTAPDRPTAERIARALVEERLAACVNLIPGLGSIYRWKGKIEHEEEVLCLIKTRKALMTKLTRRLTALHPYDVPEVIAVEVSAGARPYLNWLAEQTR